MIKSWWVVCQVNMDANREVKMIVKANTEKKAKSFAINDLYKEGYFHVKLLSCEECVNKGEVE